MVSRSVLVVTLALACIANLCHSVSSVRQRCPTPKMRRWHRVSHSMIKSTYHLGVEVAYSDAGGKLVISAKVKHYGCGGLGSIAIAYIRGDWVQVRYTQEFRGTASCWKIFGTTAWPKYSRDIAFYRNRFQKKPIVAMEDYSERDGDGIFNEYRMNTRSKNKFDGKVYRCDNQRDNFWHTNNGEGLRRATVMLRRRSLTQDAGIVTETSCGIPSYVIKDIYVLM